MASLTFMKLKELKDLPTEKTKNGIFIKLRHFHYLTHFPILQA